MKSQGVSYCCHLPTGLDQDLAPVSSIDIEVRKVITPIGEFGIVIYSIVPELPLTKWCKHYGLGLGWVWTVPLEVSRVSTSSYTLSMCSWYEVGRKYIYIFGEAIQTRLNL